MLFNSLTVIFRARFNTLQTTPPLSKDSRTTKQVRRTDKESGVSFFRKLTRDNAGATAIEYGLIAALIAVAAIGAMGGVGNKVGDTMTNVSNKL